MWHRLFGCVIVHEIASGDRGSIFGFMVYKMALGEVSLNLFDFPLQVGSTSALCSLIYNSDEGSQASEGTQRRRPNAKAL